MIHCKPLILALALAVGLGAGDAMAQAWPNKPMRLIVPFAAGGRVDAVARLVCEALQKDLGQPCVVESKAGAGGAIGADFVARSPPDGYTLLLASAGVMAILHNVDKKLSYKPRRDFTVINRLVEGYTYIGVNKAFAAQSLPELVTMAKAKPGSIGYATSGVGTYGHLAGELFTLAAAAPMIHIPYKGTGAAIADIRAGHVPVMIAGELGDLAKDGSVRILATTNETRAPDFPNVPTMKELGFPQFVAHSWIGLFAPAGMEPTIVKQLNASVEKVLKDGPTQAKLRALGSEPSFMDGTEFAKRVGADIDIYADIISKAGLKFE